MRATRLDQEQEGKNESNTTGSGGIQREATKQKEDKKSNKSKQKEIGSKWCQPCGKDQTAEFKQGLVSSDNQQEQNKGNISHSSQVKIVTIQIVSKIRL